MTALLTANRPAVSVYRLTAALLLPSGLRLWHKLAIEYGQPRGVSYFRLASPAAAASPTAAVLGALWLRLVEEALAEDSYLAGGPPRLCRLHHLEPRNCEESYQQQ